MEKNFSVVHDFRTVGIRAECSKVLSDWIIHIIVLSSFGQAIPMAKESLLGKFIIGDVFGRDLFICYKLFTDTDVVRFREFHAWPGSTALAKVCESPVESFDCAKKLAEFIQ